MSRSDRADDRRRRDVSPGPGLLLHMSVFRPPALNVPAQEPFTGVSHCQCLLHAGGLTCDGIYIYHRLQTPGTNIQVLEAGATGRYRVWVMEQRPLNSISLELRQLHDLDKAPLQIARYKFQTLKPKPLFELRERKPLKLRHQALTPSPASKVSILSLLHRGLSAGDPPDRFYRA